MSVSVRGFSAEVYAVVIKGCFYLFQADYIEPRIGYAELVYNESALNKMYENVSGMLHFI